MLVMDHKIVLPYFIFPYIAEDEDGPPSAKRVSSCHQYSYACMQPIVVVY